MHSATSNAKKVLLITNIPNPYRIPLFNELNEQCREQGYNLKIIFGALGYDRRKWRVNMADCSFDYEVLPTRRLVRMNPEKVSFTYPGLLRLVKRETPDVIITNAFSIASTKLWLLSWLNSTPYIVWSGAIQRNGHTESKLRSLQRRLLVKRAAGFIAYGSRAKQYLRDLGASSDYIRIAINTVDTDFFHIEAEKARFRRKEPLNGKSLLYVGHLTKGKRLDHLFHAVRQLKGLRNDFLLRLVGDGPERDYLRRLADELDISEHVRFEGFRQRRAVAAYLSSADCFLFPSEYDIWGLVLIEAMAACVPCLVSTCAGATTDLIRDGITGYALDFSESEAVAKRIDALLDDRATARSIGLNARSFISEKASLDRSVGGFMDSILAVTGGASSFRNRQLYAA